MKPSEIIIKQVKDLAMEDIKKDHPYDNWESRETMFQIILENGELTGYFMKAILDYLDSQTKQDEGDSK